MRSVGYPAITDPPRRSRIKGHNHRSSNSLDVPACVKKKIRLQNQSREQLELVAARDCRHPIHAGFQQQIYHHWGKQESRIALAGKIQITAFSK